jgi:hypothetical protein
MIWYTTIDPWGRAQHQETIMISRVVRLSKDPDSYSITIIHLDNGDQLRSSDDIKVLTARINAAK